VSAFFGEIYANLVALNGSYATYAPCAVINIIALVKGYVLFKIGNSLMYVAVILGKIGNADVFLKLTVTCVFFSVTFDNFPSRLYVFLVVFKNYF